MNCPHCGKEIAAELIRSANQSLIASRPRPGARGLVRNPAGKNKKRAKRASRKGVSK
jgi:hypothetical protein